MTVPLALLVATLPVQEPVLDCRWEEAARVRIEVHELEDKIPREYAIDVAVYPDGDGAGFVLRRTAFEPTSIAGLEFDRVPSREPFAEWIAQMENMPSLRLAESGAFEELGRTAESVDALFGELTRGANAQEVAAARVQYLTPSYSEEWFAPLRHDWSRWCEQWLGLPTTAGTYELELRTFVGTPKFEWLAVPGELVVGEPYDEDGRTLVRLERKVKVDESHVGRHGLEFVRSLGANPSHIPNAIGFTAVIRDTAVLDTGTWLPVSVRSVRKTFLSMETTRSKWREEATEEFRYRFDWTLRDAE